MCNPRPGSRCVSDGTKALTKAVQKSDNLVKRMEDTDNSLRVTKSQEELDFHAERNNNIAKALSDSVADINTKKVYLYAASRPSAALKTKLEKSTSHFDAYEKSLLKSEDDLMKTGKFLKKFQDGADAARKANEKRDKPVDQKTLCQGLDTKTFPKLQKDIANVVKKNYETKIRMTSDKDEKNTLKAQQEHHLNLLDDACTIAQNDARKVYVPKKNQDNEE